MRVDSRQDDLTKVFDKVWKANHNNDVEEARKKEKEFVDKLFDVKSREKNSKPLTVNEQVENLQKNMEIMKNIADQNKIKELKDKI